MVMVSIRNVEQNIEMYSCLKIMQRVNIIIFLLVASHRGRRDDASTAETR
jgi:hypothetical protein